MIAVIFEVNLKSDGMLEYFNIAAELATLLSEIDGLIPKPLQDAGFSMS